MEKNRTTDGLPPLKTVPDRPLLHNRPWVVAAHTPLDRYARRILLAVLANIEALAELGDQLSTGATLELATIRDFGVPYAPDEWWGKWLDTADRKAYSRATARLEGAGLVVRIMGPKQERVTHLQLTEAGLSRALHLAGRRADRPAIAAALQRTAWGKALAERLAPRPQAAR